MYKIQIKVTTFKILILNEEHLMSKQRQSLKYLEGEKLFKIHT